MRAHIEWAEDRAPGEVVNCPGRIFLGFAPPDDLVLYIPLPGGGFAKVQVDCHEFDLVLDGAHEKLVEAAADADEAARPAVDVVVAEETPPPPAEPAMGLFEALAQPAAAAAEVGSVPSQPLEETPTLTGEADDADDKAHKGKSKGKSKARYE